MKILLTGAAGFYFAAFENNTRSSRAS